MPTAEDCNVIYAENTLLRCWLNKSESQNVCVCNFSVSYCGWVGWGSPPRWVLLQLRYGHNSNRKWWCGTVLHSQWEEKEQPEATPHIRRRKIIRLTKLKKIFCPLKHIINARDTFL